MRTTLTIDDDLLDRARREAAEHRSTLTEVVNRALRRGLTERSAAPAIRHTITFGDPAMPLPDAARMAALDDEEIDWLRRKCGL